MFNRMKIELKDENYQLHHVKIFEHLLDVLRKIKSPNKIVFLDMKIENMKYLKMIRKHYKRFPVMLFSDDLKSHELTLINELGVSQIFTKPVDFDFLKKRINKFIKDDEGSKIDENLILVVEDQSNLRMMYEDFLSMQGYKVIMAANGEEGLEKLKYRKPFCMLLDLDMPVMDGMAVLENLKNNKKKPPVIMTTAHADLRTVKATMKYDIFGYLRKPLNLGELTSRLNELKDSLGGKK